jgi:hypothetical protein
LNAKTFIYRGLIGGRHWPDDLRAGRFGMHDFLMIEDPTSEHADSDGRWVCAKCIWEWRAVTRLNQARIRATAPGERQKFYRVPKPAGRLLRGMPWTV